MTTIEMRRCEFCGCDTNAKIRACCDVGNAMDRTGVPIRDEIRELARRGNITPDEVTGIRCNSYEWEALVPALTDKALIKHVRHALQNCFTSHQRPCSTYNQAIEALYTPELIRRLEIAEIDYQRRLKEAEGFAEVLDEVREALGQEATHYLVIADDVRALVCAVERDDGSAKEILRKLRAAPGLEGK